MENIMVIVPHEDDEVLMTAGIIEQAVKEGKKVTVVMATNGDYEGTDKVSGSVRLRETMNGLGVLGVPEENIIFMGYADTGMYSTESFIYKLYQEKDENRLFPGHCSKGTYGLPEKRDYHFMRYGEPAEYTRKNFKEDLKAIILEEKPDTVFTTSEEDMHGDHSGLFLFVREILSEQTDYHPQLYSGVVHSKAGDENWPERKAEVFRYLQSKYGTVPCFMENKREKVEEFSCPTGFNEGSLKWEERIRFPVPENMMAADFANNKKVQALDKHVNALKPDAVEFLYSFIASEELFWKITY